MKWETESGELARAEVGAETFARWERRGQQISDRIDGKRQSALAEQARRAKGKRATIYLLRQLGDNIVAAADGVAPCKRGCNGCCHMATMVTEAEAELIAQETGAKMTTPRRFNDFASNLQDRYAGVPCTFLVAGECSIYAQRPMACRLHLTVADDSTRCKITPGKPVRAPSLDVSNYDTVAVQALDGLGMVRYADIREFFPAGKGRAKRK